MITHNFLLIKYMSLLFVLVLLGVGCEQNEPSGEPSNNAEAGMSASAGDENRINEGTITAGETTMAGETNMAGEINVAGETGMIGETNNAGDMSNSGTEADPECQTRCGFRWCGDDGCGGVCGPCSDEMSCVSGPWPELPIQGHTCQPDSYPGDESSAVCPPNLDELGKVPGAIIPDVGLVKCSDSYPVNHRGMCADKVTITYQINVDCAPCITYVNQVLADLNEEFASQGLKIYVIFDKAEECSNVRLFSPRTEGIEYLIDIRLGVTMVFEQEAKDQP